MQVEISCLQGGGAGTMTLQVEISCLQRGDTGATNLQVEISCLKRGDADMTNLQVEYSVQLVNSSHMHTHPRPIILYLLCICTPILMAIRLLLEVAEMVLLEHWPRTSQKGTHSIIYEWTVKRTSHSTVHGHTIDSFCPKWHMWLVYQPNLPTS